MIVSEENPILTLKYMTEENENQFFDRKSAKKSVKELANYVASFANASGGTLVIGIADDGKIEGFEDCPNKYNDFLKVTSIDYLKTIPNYKNETLEVVNHKGNNDKILLVHVKPSPDILIRNVKDEVYLRQGDSSNKLSAEQIKILEYDRREISFEDEINMRSSINNIDLDMVNIYKKAIGADEKDSIELLRARNFLVKKDGEEHLTNSGVLLFAEDPSIFFPTARVRVIKFDGTEMHTGAELNIVKDKTFALPLYKVIKETQKFVDTQLREFNHLGNNGEFVTVPEYPKFAWEERNHKCRMPS
ncbi:MAG: putative DNA binding domain-containing protein [Clostridia bacterium]|nr:putative DNA binding domain-containing protein [Clostridia bacterium]